MSPQVRMFGRDNTRWNSSLGLTTLGHSELDAAECVSDALAQRGGSALATNDRRGEHP